MRRGAIRDCWSSCCAARSTDLPRSRRSAILIGCRLRGDKALRLDGATPALPLDSFFALHPAMPNLHRLYRSGAATIVHAVATPYRERSHFDGQDVLESGIATPGATDTGWLNRALASLPSARPRRRTRGFRGRPDCPPAGTRAGAGAVVDAAPIAASEP